MISPNLIIREADKDGLPATTVERDYVLAHVLTSIVGSDRQDGFVFKGGTALRLCHFPSYRYSADLDFSLINGLSGEAALESVSAALLECRERVGFPVLELNEAKPPRIAYLGPLARARPRSLKLDLADDELVENTAKLAIRCRYPDQEAGECLGYTLDEIAAEKLRCVMQRLQCRDLYDLDQLLVGGGVDAEMVWPAFERKARHRHFDPAQFLDRFEDRVPEWSRRWEGELSDYVDPVPHFDGLLRAVRRELRNLLR